MLCSFKSQLETDIVRNSFQIFDKILVGEVFHDRTDTSLAIFVFLSVWLWHVSTNRLLDLHIVEALLSSDDVEEC